VLDLEPVGAWTVDDVTYDPETHTSTLPDGTNVPHVTAVLSAVGVSRNWSNTIGSSWRAAHALEQAGARGTAVHADCHAYDDNDLDLASVDARVLPYVEAWAEARRSQGLVPLARERRIYHQRLNYTGILDGIFRSTKRDGSILVDLKTGDPEDSAAHLQTAAYAGAVGDWPDGIAARWVIWLRPGRKVPYTVIDYTARPDHWLDWPKWEACLTVYREQAERRTRVAVVR
jgi:hypothetical protein